MYGKGVEITRTTNYRPISLTNCLARLCERFIILQLNTQLKQKNIIVKEQSEFRAYRQTKEIEITITLKLYMHNFQAFNKKSKKL